MSQSRLQILHELFHSEELSQAELQERLGVEGAVITRIVKQLEAARLVTRRADPQDNRFTLVALSPEARQLQATDDSTAKFKETFGSQLLEGLSERELTQLMRTMKRIQENAEAITSRL
jgi:DNA-binding MarR family transcriptional regulator